MNQNCDPFLIEISELTDQNKELSKKTLSHLTICTDCAQFHALWSPVGKLSQAASIPVEATVSAGLADRVIQQIPALATPQQQRKESTLFKLWAPLAAAATLTLSLIIWNHQGGKQKSYEVTAPIAQLDLSLPEEFTSISPEKINQGISSLTLAGSGKVKDTSKHITKVTRKLHYLATHFSEYIPTLPGS